MHASPPFRLFYLHRLDHVPFARVIQAMAQFYRTPNYVVRWVEREREHTLLASVTYHNHTVVLALSSSFALLRVPFLRAAKRGLRRLLTDTTLNF